MNNKCITYWALSAFILIAALYAGNAKAETALPDGGR